MATPKLPDVSLLVADASPHMRRMIREIVLRAGVRRVLEAPDGAEAMGLLAEAKPDLVIVDWDVPVLSGEDFVRLTRTVATSPAPHVPILLTITRPRRSAIERAVFLGVNAILAKPFSPAAVWARLEEAIRRPRVFVDKGELLPGRPQAGAAAA